MSARRNRRRVLELQRVGSTDAARRVWWQSWSDCRHLSKLRAAYWRKHPFQGPPRLCPMEIGRIDGFRFIVS